MKKIFFLLAVMIAIISCKASKDAVVIKSTPPPAEKDTTRNLADYFYNLLILHPVDNHEEAKEKTYHLFHDYTYKYLDFTDNENTSSQIMNFLPRSITVDSTLGRSISLEIIASTPFSNFTDSTLQAFARSEGIAYTEIGNYRLGYASTIVADPESIQAKWQLLDIMEPERHFIKSQPTVPDKRTPVDGARDMLTRHPIEDPVKGSDKKVYYFLTVNGRIYFTDDVDLYNEFVKDLPILKSNAPNGIIVQGLGIKPISVFPDSTTIKMAMHAGLKFDGGTKGAKNTINNLLVYKISAYLIVFDYQAVAAKLRKELRVQEFSSPSNFSQAQASAPAVHPTWKEKPIDHPEQKKVIVKESDDEEAAAQQPNPVIIQKRRGPKPTYDSTIPPH